MLDIKLFLDDIRQSVLIKEEDDASFFAWTYFYLGNDESIAIKVYENDEGFIMLSDCHTTMDYLELCDVDVEKYSDKLEKIIKRFGLMRDGNVFRMAVPIASAEYDRMDSNLRIYLSYFIQALTLIAYINM